MTGAWEKSLDNGAAQMKMGSFFSGSGGFELAGEHAGIRTVWESEIEPFPMRVTQMRFPDAQHLGDISRINGAELEPVDIVVGGSPCQNMSIAGDRKGLDGGQSVLFREYVRIVKEMRQKHGKPRIMVWENVPGAFSSNKGEDFRCVLEEIVRIVQEGISVARPPGGKWRPAGAVLGDSYSVAWRVLDSQYWGVPQRRKRIYLVADFGGQSAGEILFKRKGLFRDTAQGRQAREETPGSAVCGTEAAGRKGHVIRCYDISDRRRDLLENMDISPTLTVKMGTGGGNVPLVAAPYSIGNGQADNLYLDEKARTLDCMHDAQAVIVPQEDEKYIVRRLTPLECCRLQGFPDNWTDGLSDEAPDKKTVQFWIGAWTEWWALAGRAKGIRRPKDEKAVRRWLKKPASDTALYKMWGNGIALPCAQYVFEGIAEMLGVAESDTQKGEDKIG